MKTETWVRLAAMGICAAATLAASYILIRYFAGILIPFVLSALVASLLRPAARFLKKRFRLPEKLGGTVLILTAVLALSFGIVSLGRYLYREVGEGIAALPAMLADEENPLRKLVDLIETWSGDGPAAGGDWEGLYSMLSGMVENAVRTASEALTEGATAVIVKLPRVLLSLLVTVISLFYLFFDHEKLLSQLKLFLGGTAVCRLSSFMGRTRKVAGAYTKAYLSLLLLTYSELLAGFLILNIERPVPLALLIALIDLLPVLGVGTVLIPYGIFCLIAGDMYRGIGLLVLFALMYVVRQFAEPRLLSTTLGVHPLFTLFAVYAGFSLFGIFGVLLAPFVLYGLKAVCMSFREEKKNGEP